MSEKVYCSECRYFVITNYYFADNENCAKAPKAAFLEENYKRRPKTERGYSKPRPRDLNAKNKCKNWEPLE